MSPQPSNDTSLLPVLKFIGFIDSNGMPTERWRKFRGADGREILGMAICDGYKDLFDVYPDAHKRPKGELESVFSTSSSGGSQVIAKLVATFSALIEEAEITNNFEASDHVKAATLHASVGAKPISATKNLPAVHIDVQIHISPESTIEQIDQIFSSMAKHLYTQQS